MKRDPQLRQNEKLARKYLKSVREELPLHGNRGRKYMQNISYPIYDFATSHGATPLTMEDLTDAFGEPKDIATNYKFLLTLDDIKEWHLGRYRLLSFIFMTIFTACLIIGSYSYKQWKFDKDTKISSVEVTIYEHGVYPTSRDAIIVIATPMSNNEIQETNTGNMED